MRTAGPSGHRPGKSGSESGSSEKGLDRHTADRGPITRYLHERFQGLERFFENYLSLRSMQWRFEARTTDRPFAEIALAKSSLYKVEQVFLIHRESGLVLQDVAAQGATFEDPDLVGGMLTAIQSFTSDSLGGSQGFDTMRLGEMQVWIQPGPKAELVGFICGSAPRELKQVFKDAVDRIHDQLARELDGFSGVGVDAARPYLEACLLGRASVR